MKKKMAAAGLAAGLVAGAGAGLILELAGSAGASSTSVSAIVEDDTTDTVTATDTADTAPADHSARLQEVLQPLVDDGTITQAQADAVIAALDAAGPVGGPGGPGRRGPGFSVVATTLGMTEDEVREAISNGQTLAQLAEAKGTTAQALIDAILADVTANLDEKVAAGDLTQEEADARLAEATTRVAEFVNNTQEARPMGGPGGPGHHGPGGDDADDTTDDTTADTVTTDTAGS